MEWWLLFLLFFGGLLLLLLLGVPIAFSFLFISILGAFLFLGGWAGLIQLPQQYFSLLANFTFTPIPAFILLGEILFQSGVAKNALDAIDEWVGSIKARLSLVATFGGTLFAALTGSTIANTALLGSTLYPDMRQRGYDNSLSVGPCVAVGGLAMLIPPSNLSVVLAVIAKVSVGKLLIAGIIPGLLLAFLYAAYIMVRAQLDPSLAPSYKPVSVPVATRLRHVALHILPLGLVIFSVIGFILLGIATPTEAAASGAIAAFLLAAIYRKLTLDALKKSLISTIEISVMVFMIVGAAQVFSNLLAFTGVGAKLASFGVNLPLSPMLILVGSLVIVLILGCFMESISIISITIPIFMPIILSLGFDPIWFSVLILISIEVGFITPPFGILLYVMKGLVPPDVTMGDIVRATAPFLICDAIAIIIIIAFPQVVLWAPSLLQQ